MTGFENDFKENSLEPLQFPVTMTGIAGMLITTHQGIDKYEVIKIKREVSLLFCKYLYMPKLKCRLFSSQQYIVEKGNKSGDKFTLK